jgi:hypothetical protein
VLLPAFGEPKPIIVLISITVGFDDLLAFAIAALISPTSLPFLT